MRVSFAPLLIAFFLLVAPAYGAVDLENGCGGGGVAALALKSCDQYKDSPLFLQNALIRSAYKACQEYFSAAWRAQNLLCSFDHEQAGFSSAATSVVKSVSGENTSQDAGHDTYAGAKALTDSYLTEIRARYPALKKLGGDYVNLIGRVNSQGKANIVAEFVCANRPDSDVPGMLQAGLAVKSHRDAVDSLNNLLLELGALGRTLVKVGTASAQSASTTATNSKQLGVASASTITLSNDAAAIDRSDRLDGPKRLFLQGIVKNVVDKALLARLPGFAMGLVVAKSAGIVGVVAYEYAEHGTIRVPELIAIGIYAFYPIAGPAATLAVAEMRVKQQEFYNYGEYAKRTIPSGPNAVTLARAYAASKGQVCHF